MGKLTISMAIFNSFLYVYQRVSCWVNPCPFSKLFSVAPNGRAEAGCAMPSRSRSLNLDQVAKFWDLWGFIDENPASVL